MTRPQVDPQTDADSADPTTQVSEAVAGVRSGVSAVRRAMVGLIAHLPATARVTRTATRETMGALQTLPDDTLRSLAATAMGLGIGLSFTRARRLAFVAGMVPAALIGAAIAARPVQSPLVTDPGA
jgi:hypothetical protein